MKSQTQMTSDNNQKSKLRYLPTMNALVVYSFLIVVYAIAFAIVLPVRKRLPNPLAETENSEFSAARAWGHLEQITAAPHPFNSKANQKNQEYLAGVLRELSERGKALNRKVDLVTNDSSIYTGISLGEGPYSGWRYFESTNLLFRVGGTRNRSEALLISAHFDSVPFSHGATDDGIGVVVALEMARNIIENPIADTVIFNINNCEEMGLLGSEGFMKHPWAKDVRAFINLEGAGAGGRAMVFRSSDEPLNRFYSNSPFPHTSVIANDVFKLGLIKSSTDFEVYAYRYNVPGLDIAFYQRRSHYHTLLDNLNSTSPSSVQQMGGVALATTRALANSEYLYRGADYTTRSAIHYDILGKTAVVYGFKSYIGVSIAFLVIIPLFYIVGYFLMRRHQLEKAQRINMKEFTAPILRSFLSTALTIVFGILFNILFGFYISKANGNVVYGRATLVMFAFSSTTIWAYAVAQWLWRWLENRYTGSTFVFKSNISRDRLAYHGMMLVWWFSTLIAAVTGAAGLGIFYYVLWLTVAHLIGALILEGIEFRWNTWGQVTSSPKWIWPIRMAIGCIPPLLLVIDILNILADATSQSVADGTPPFMVYVLFSVAFTTCLMCIIPWFQRGDSFPSLISLLSLWVVIMIILTGVLFPYNAEAPIRVFHNVYHEPVTGSTWTVFRSVCDLPKFLKSLDPNASPNCHLEGGIHECTWNSTTKPAFTQVNQENSPIITEVLTNTLPGGKREIQVAVSTPETRTCSFLLNYNPTEQYAVNGNMIKDDFSGNRIFVFKREFEKNITLSIRTDKMEKHPISIYCYYDDYKKHLPTFDDFRSTMPDWSVISLRGFGALTVISDIEV